ncbi:flagellar basal body L-ring protein FlgH [Rhodalgimonas zhirmunskyi]|uniref:Flagellar L-ring protein n=1 Tax=Rhodalgimonas zhirmunskyi TaxID=2964767 RepID=A0AAJ1UCF2_9RHOB|nr:flagellar basal body L-ring protein FlgH [Rhodoalgimonas zhirmunskyi]MDQ2093986.1 flagellar basal body L-ring protein FlgH [Rhodoalgimonas zhirmunskyi]
MILVRSLMAVAIVGNMAACSRMDHFGKPPSFTETETIANPEHVAMMNPGLPLTAEERGPLDRASLWSRNRHSLLGDRRAVKRGDIMTVVIEIDDSAEISNNTSRSRSGSEGMSVPGLLGIPQRLNESLPEGASMDEAVSLNSSSSSSGEGSVSRNEKLTLRVAATITDVLPNGVLAIAARQEVRVNFELRELIVSGFVRPEDVSRQNEITYDKIASARISYGGRGQISDMQQPRYGQQVLDMALPF